MKNTITKKKKKQPGWIPTVFFLLFSLKYFLFWFWFAYLLGFYGVKKILMFSWVDVQFCKIKFNLIVYKKIEIKGIKFNIESKKQPPFIFLNFSWGVFFTILVPNVFSFLLFGPCLLIFLHFNPTFYLFCILIPKTYEESERVVER